MCTLFYLKDTMEKQINWAQETLRTLEAQYDLSNVPKGFMQATVNHLNNAYLHESQVDFDHYDHIRNYEFALDEDREEARIVLLESYLITVRELLEDIDGTETLYDDAQLAFSFDEMTEPCSPAQIKILDKAIVEFCMIACRDWGDTLLVDKLALQQEEAMYQAA